jgi:hypothetical protein
VHQAGHSKFVIEVVNVDVPQQRAYMHLNSLQELRAFTLKCYLDEALKFYEKAQNAENEEAS